MLLMAGTIAWIPQSPCPQYAAYIRQACEYEGRLDNDGAGLVPSAANEPLGIFDPQNLTRNEDSLG